MTDLGRILWLICWFGSFVPVCWWFARREEKMDDVDKQLRRNLQEVQLRRRRKEGRR